MKTLDEIRNTDIRARINIKNIVEAIEEYQNDWEKHVKRMRST
jgi:hypothetical protein